MNDFDLLGYPNPPYDVSRDNMSDEDRIKCGCLALIMHFVVIIAVMLLVAFLSSCASTSHVERRHTSTQTDTLATELVTNTSTAIEVNDSTTVSGNDTQHASSTVTESSTNEETITEHIVEITDSAGNRTVTTDRTTNRRGTSDRTATTDEWLQHQYERTNVLSYRLDSINNVLQTMQQSHTASNDSIFHESQRTPTAKTWWERIKSLMMAMIIIALLTLLIVQAYRQRLR